MKVEPQTLQNVNHMICTAMKIMDFDPLMGYNVGIVVKKI